MTDGCAAARTPVQARSRGHTVTRSNTAERLLLGAQKTAKLAHDRCDAGRWSFRRRSCSCYQPSRVKAFGHLSALQHFGAHCPFRQP
eukprot:1840973-Prymnesium_polylepis.1